MPLPRDMLLPALQDGKIDMVVAQLTVTPARQKLVDFTNPTRKDVSEVLVTGPGAPPIAIGRRPVGQGGLRPQDVELLREPDRRSTAS